MSPTGKTLRLQKKHFVSWAFCNAEGRFNVLSPRARNSSDVQEQKHEPAEPDEFA